MAGPSELVTGIVVGMLDYRDADRIVRLLTPTHGRVAALARYARSSRRRFGGSLDLGNRIEAGLRRGKGSLGTLDSAVLQDGRDHVRSDLDRVMLMMYACELVAALAREDHPEPRLYGLLEMACVVLDASTAAPELAWRLGLEAKALTFAGIAPVLGRCAVCGEPCRAPMSMSVLSGGAVHTACEAGGPDVSESWLAAVERARRTPLRDLVDTELPPGPQWALAQAVEAHIGKALKSRAVLAGLSG